MPILWKVVGKNFFRVFFLTFLVCIFLSLIGNIQTLFTLVKFESQYQNIFLIYLSTLLELSGIFLGFCSLLASFYASSQLRLSGQMLVLLPFGIRSKEIQTPLLHISLFLSFLSFLAISELFPYVKTKNSFSQQTAVNPLPLLFNYKLSGFYESFVSMDLEENGKVANNFFLIQNNSLLNGLLLFQANQVLISPEGKFKADQAHLICHPSIKGSPSLVRVLENADHLSFFLQEAPFLFSQKLSSHCERLPLSMLLTGEHTIEVFIEFLRRISLSLFPFIFTLLGASVGEKCKITSLKTSITLLIALFFLCTALLQYTNNVTSPHWKAFLYIFPHILSFSLAKFTKCFLNI